MDMINKVLSACMHRLCLPTRVAAASAAGVPVVVVVAAATEEAAVQLKKLPRLNGYASAGC